jgi:hypothetical protein
MLKDMVRGMRPIWIAATLATLVVSVIMLCGAEPETKKYGMVMLLADLAQGWLFFHEKAMQWLLRTWQTKEKWKQRTLFDALRVVGGMGLMAIFVALGAFILFAETCLPFDPFKQ